MRTRLRRRVMVRRRLVPRRVRNHPVTRAAAVITALALMGAFGERVAADVADAQRRWGEQRSVVVARHRIEIGETVTEDDVASQTWPAGLVPEGAVDESPV